MTTGAAAQPSGFGRGRPLRRIAVRLPPLAKIAIGVAVLVGIGLAVKTIGSPGPPPRCLFTCYAPPRGVALATGETFRSSTYGFSFDYTSQAQPIQVNGAAVAGFNYAFTSGSFAGQILIAAGFGQQPLSALITSEANALGQSEVSNMSPVGPINGAEIGFTPGEGELYSAQFTDSQGNVYPVQVGIIAVQHNNEWVYVAGIGATNNSGPTAPAFVVFDDILDHWQWTG